MKKFILVLAAIVFCMAAAQTHAQWGLRAEVYTDFPLGGHLLQGVTGNVFFGGFKRSRTFIPGTNQTLQILNDSNIYRYENGVLSSVGKIFLDHPASVVRDYKVLYGNEYVSVYLYGSTGFKNSIYRKDKNDGIFKPVLEIKNTGSIDFMHDLGNGKVLVAGNIYQAIDKNGVAVVYNNAAIWDIVNNTWSQIGNADTYASHSVGDDKSVAIVGQGGTLWIAYFGSTSWKNAQYASIPIGSQMKAISWFNLDRAYGAWRVSADATYRLAKMEGGAWSVLGTLYRSPATLSTSYEEMSVRIERYKDLLIIAHSGTHFNGNPVGPLFSYNTKTGEVKDLPLPSGITTSNFDEAYVKAIGDSVYFISTHERLSLGRQRMWVLLDNATLPVKLSAFSGKEQGGSHLLRWSTQSEENVSHFEVEASENGQTFSKVAHVLAHNRSGGYEVRVAAKWNQTFYRLKMVDRDGTSEYSAIIRLGKESVTLSISPNPLIGNTLQVRGLLQNTPIQIISSDGRVLKSQIIAPEQRVDMSSIPKGIYFLRIGDKTLRFVK